MSQPHRIRLDSVLLGDELGQIKLVQLNTSPQHDSNSQRYFNDDNQLDFRRGQQKHEHWTKSPNSKLFAKTLDSFYGRNQRHRIVRVVADCMQPEPAISRAITSIRPIESVHETHLDTTDKPNNLFLITNKVGQMFVCDTDAIRTQVEYCTRFGLTRADDDETTISDNEPEGDFDDSTGPVLSPVYYNMNNRVPVLGSQPVNQTNVLVVYKNGDIQHVNIGQEVLQTSLKIKRKAIRTLGLGYNSDAKAVHWRIDGSTGICYFDSEAISAHMNENDPLTDIVLSSPTHKLSKKRVERSQQNPYNKSPCIKSRKYNEQDRLIPTHVINMITSRTSQLNARICKWSSLTSLNLIYRKLALYDLVGSENYERTMEQDRFCINTFKLNDDRLAVGGSKYALRVYDVQTQQAIYNCRTGSKKNPLSCPAKGEPIMIADIDWLGGNKTVKRCPNMLATCSGVDSIVKVYDLRSPKPVYYIDLTDYTQNKWQPYENQPRGCMFNSICASGAPYSTTVQSQQLALGATNGQLHFIDLRFVTKSHRVLGKMSGFCGGSVRELRFVSESFESSKMISCASDRFVRIHKIQTSFTSVISQKLSSKIFLGTKPTCIQPVCDEILQSYLASLGSRCESETLLSTIGSGTWSLL